jgi:hypothetical protein
MTMNMIIGCALAILGFCLYSHAKLASAAAAARPVLIGPGSDLATDCADPEAGRAGQVRSGST